LKTKIIFVLVAVLLTLAAVSNPTKSQYVDWATNKMIEKTGTGLLGYITLMVAPSLIDRTTQADNFIFFSLYQTKIADSEVVVLGAFDKFVQVTKIKIPENSNP